MSLKLKVSFILTSGLLFLMFSNCSQKLSDNYRIQNFSSLSPVTNPNNGGGSGGGGSISAPINPLFAYGKMDPYCLDVATYDACLFYKSPVAQQKAPFSEILKIGTDVYDLQTFAVKLQNRISPNELKSNSIRVFASSGTVPQFINGQLRPVYQSDTGKSWLAQIMTYFYLTTLENEFIRRVGNFYAADQAIDVDAYSTVNSATSPTAGNAYYSKAQNKIVLGYATSETGTIAHEMALSSEAYIHEMGHANLRHATSSDLAMDTNMTCAVRAGGLLVIKSCDQVYTTDTFLAKACNTMFGCASAINEGQADFHVHMMFPDSPDFFETIKNRTVEPTSSGVPRNVVHTLNWTVTNYFDRSSLQVSTTAGMKAFKGEIHSLGTAYASILYEIYTHKDMSRNHFERLFNEHLKMVNGSTDFRGALQIFKTLSTAMQPQLGNKNYGPLITSIFAKRGIQ